MVNCEGSRQISLTKLEYNEKTSEHFFQVELSFDQIDNLNLTEQIPLSSFYN